MKRNSTTETVLPAPNVGAVGKAWDDVSASFERFRLTAGIGALGAMMEKEAEELCGPRHARNEGRRGRGPGGQKVALSAFLDLRVFSGPAP
jgi:putative transposase